MQLSDTLQSNWCMSIVAYSVLQCAGHRFYDVALQLEDEDEVIVNIGSKICYYICSWWGTGTDIQCLAKLGMLLF